MFFETLNNTNWFLIMNIKMECNWLHVIVIDFMNVIDLSEITYGIYNQDEKEYNYWCLENTSLYDHIYTN